MNPILTLLFSCGLLLMVASSSFAGTCFTTNCHKAIADLKNLHQPVKDEECLECHVRRETTHPIFGGKSFGLKETGAKLCELCHARFERKKQGHAPVREGNCLGCHGPHGGNGKFLLPRENDLTPLCVGCHDPSPFKEKFMHGPVAVGACGECHEFHEANEKGLLKMEGRKLCLKCHEDFARSMTGATNIHPPVKDKPCTSCHAPHGSPVANILKKKMPDLCTDCHEGTGKKLAAVKFPHKPIQQESGCGGCHSSHFSQAKGLLPADEMTVCLGCHGKDNLGKPPLKNIKKEITGKKQLHGPVAEGKCKACHDPHGSGFPRILKATYPVDLYAAYKEGTYDFCMQCHEKNLLRFADTTIYTKFRNGNRNLHFVHVADKKKGRSCRLCHDVHASDGEKLIGKKSATFGEWKIPMNFKTTATGGSCAPGCHRPFAYDRDKAVDYRIDPK